MASLVAVAVTANHMADLNPSLWFQAPVCRVQAAEPAAAADQPAHLTLCTAVAASSGARLAREMFSSTPCTAGKESRVEVKSSMSSSVQDIKSFGFSVAGAWEQTDSALHGHGRSRHSTISE